MLTSPAPSDPPAASGLAEDRRALGFRLLLVGLAAIGPFSLNIFKPCLPWIKADLSADITTVQLGLSAAMILAAVATTSAGWLADRLGRTPVTIACVWLYVLSCIAGAAAPTIEVLVSARVIQAASSSVALSLARTLIHDGKHQVQRTIARVTFFAVVAVLLAPALGGALIDHIGWRAVFGLTAAIGALLLWPVHTTLAKLRAPAPLPARADAATTARRVAALVRSPVFMGYALQSALHFSIFFAFTSASAYIMVDVLGRDATEYGIWFFGVALVVGAGLLAADRISSRLPAGRIAMVGSTLVALGCGISAFLLLSPVVPLDPAVLFLPSALAGFGVGLALPATNAAVMDVVPRTSGTASGLLSSMQYLLGGVFAQLVVQDEPNTPVVLGVLVLVGGLASLAVSVLSAGHDVVRDRDRG